MKKKFFCLLSAFALTFCAGTALAYGAEANIYPLTASYSFEESQIGETFDVEFYVENNSEGIDSVTFYVTYDPDVVMFKEAIDVDKSDAMTFPISDTSESYFVSPSAINSAAARAASSGTVLNYKSSASGLTCAEFGEIKCANITGTFGGKGGLYQITDSGIIFAATFEVVGTGSTDIDVQAASAIFASTNSGAVDTDVTACSVYVTASSSSSEETTAEAEAEATTASGTSSDSSSSSSSGSSGSSGGGGSSGSSSTDSTTEATTEAAADDDTSDTTSDSSDEAAADETVEYAFTDIDQTPWAVEAINYLAGLKVVNGYTDGSFLPKNNVTRADFIIMLLNALGISGTAESNLTDVRADKYYANYVGLAKDLGIAQGYSDGTFAPEAYISRQDMMVLTWRAFTSMTDAETDTADETVLDDFADKDDISAYAEEAVSAMVSMGVVSGTNEGIEPKANTTRAQTAVIMYNILKLIEE
ncbi:MAG: S-layer homology domain-containing protein [Clostridiales bacterium]|nr:S-layer homology domain-containing protein [Clostridiales bacterium]